jgi:hypothetical protein
VASGGAVGACSRYAVGLELRTGTLVELDVPPVLPMIPFHRLPV